MTKGNTSKKVLFIAGAVPCCIFAIMLVYNLIIIIKGVVNPKVPPSVFPEITLNSGWIEGNNNIYYYTEPIDSGEYTKNEMCKPFTLIEKEVLRGTTVTTVYQVVEVFAEAIQAEPDTAAKEAWNVTIDKSGTITAAN